MLDKSNSEFEKQLEGPKGHWLWGSLKERNKDALALFVDNSKLYGDFFKVRFLHVPIFVISNADLVREVLVERSDVFVRDRVFNELSQLLGRGLLTSEGDRWRQHRKLMQPAFHQTALQGFFNTILEKTTETIDQWIAREHQATIDLTQEIMKLTLRVVSRCLFGFDTRVDEDKVSSHVEWLLPQIFYRLETFPGLNYLPTQRNFEFQRRLNELNQIISKIIIARQGDEVPRPDLLGMLMAAHDSDNGGKAKFSNSDLRDELMTLFMAGHETTANGLLWSLLLLEKNPDAIGKLRDEIRNVVGDRKLEFSDLKNLTYCRQIFEEALRLYPPVWAMPRTAAQDTQLRGVKIPKGGIASINTFLLHRNPDYFDAPEAFDPDRFSPERRKNINKHAYIPFGAGIHTCIGNHFAMMEAQIILVEIFRRLDIQTPKNMTPVPNRPRATITLRPEPNVVRLIKSLN